MAERESQIATTIEQSKRLLAAGLDPESADMMRRDKSRCYWPAWSLSKLWDLFGLDIIVGGWFSVASSTSEDVIEELVRLIENRHANH